MKAQAESKEKSKNGKKVADVKESEATTAVEQSAPPKLVGGKVVSSSAMQVETQVSKEASPIQVELKETTENLSQMLSQGKKRTLEEHQDGLQGEGQVDQNASENG